MQFSLSRRAFTAGAALLPIACTRAGETMLRTTSMENPANNTPGPINPLVRQRADAQIFRHDDGYYYMTGSVPEYDRLVLRRSRTLAGLTTAEEAVLWRHQASGPMSGFLWAPELHLFQGKWIMYFAAGPSGGGEDVFRIRTYAIACDGPDPMIGKWSVLGQFQAPWDSFNLDSTIFTHRGVSYFSWAQREPGIETNSNLYLAPLATPLTLAAKPVRLTVPELDWEIRGYKVAEAPAVLARNGRLFMTYSASATDARYCMGLLTADENANIMDPRVWSKSPHPVFTTCRETNVFGPGHNSFTTDEQGRDMLVYHGRDYEQITGDPLFDPNRHTRVQQLYFNADGSPDFGVPVGNGTLPERFTAALRPSSYLAHNGSQLFAGTADLAYTQFRIAASNTGCIMLSPIMAPDHCITVTSDNGIRLAPHRNQANGDSGVDFIRIAGGKPGSVKFESRRIPGKALAVTGNEIGLAPRNAPETDWLPS